MKTFSIHPFSESDISKIDKRLLPFLSDWLAVQKYRGKTVNIPGTWDSHFKILNYYKQVMPQGKTVVRNI